MIITPIAGPAVLGLVGFSAVGPVAGNVLLQKAAVYWLIPSKVLWLLEHKQLSEMLRRGAFSQALKLSPWVLQCQQLARSSVALPWRGVLPSLTCSGSWKGWNPESFVVNSSRDKEEDAEERTMYETVKGACTMEIRRSDENEHPQ